METVRYASRVVYTRTGISRGPKPRERTYIERRAAQRKIMDKGEKNLLTMAEMVLAGMSLACSFDPNVALARSEFEAKARELKVLLDAKYSAMEPRKAESELGQALESTESDPDWRYHKAMDRISDARERAKDMERARR